MASLLWEPSDPHRETSGSRTGKWGNILDQQASSVIQNTTCSPLPKERHRVAVTLPGCQGSDDKEAQLSLTYRWQCPPSAFIN